MAVVGLEMGLMQSYRIVTVPGVWSDDLLDRIGTTAGGFTLHSVARGYWYDESDGTTYDEPSQTLEVWCDGETLVKVMALVLSWAHTAGERTIGLVGPTGNASIVDVSPA